MKYPEQYQPILLQEKQMEKVEQFSILAQDGGAVLDEEIRIE